MYMRIYIWVCVYVFIAHEANSKMHNFQFFSLFITSYFEIVLDFAIVINVYLGEDTLRLCECPGSL